MQASSDRLEKTFSRLRTAKEKGLVSFLTAGDPTAERSLSLLHAAVAAGTDILEIGMPFSDAMADGPTIQRANQRALSAGMTLSGVLNLVREFRSKDAHTPVVLMGYCNPVARMGVVSFAKAAAAAGVDGVLLVDLPVEESSPWMDSLSAAGLAGIFLATPTTSPERLRSIVAVAKGYVYYVSLEGVSGAALGNAAALEAPLNTLRAMTPLPLAVGFGIRTAEQAKEAARAADAIIVGSALLEAVEGKDKNAAEKALSQLVRTLRTAANS